MAVTMRYYFINEEINQVKEEIKDLGKNEFELISGDARPRRR